MSKIRVLPEAFEDLSEAVDWYNDRRDGLGNIFEDAFHVSVRKVGRHPLLHPTIYQSFRRLFLTRFPYAVYYRVHRKEVVVSLVYHLARNARTLKRLLRNREKN